MSSHRVGRALITLGVVLAASSCGGEQETPAPATDIPASARALGESNVKYDALDAMEARGAVAPVIEDFSCSWAGTTADCTGRGYDIREDSSRCGYELLPCGDVDVRVHAQCADEKGRECEAELELIPRESGEPESTGTTTWPDPELPDTTAGTRPCGSVENTFGARFEVFVVKGSVSCGAARDVVANETYDFRDDDTDRWQYIDWTKGGNGVWSDVWSRRDDTEVIGAILFASQE